MWSSWEIHRSEQEFVASRKKEILSILSQGVITSADGGTMWTPLNSGLAVKYVRRLAFNRSTKALLAGAAGGGVYKIQQ